MVDFSAKKKLKIKEKYEKNINTENIERYEPTIETGLTNEQIEKRKKENLVNYDTTIKTKSIRAIIVSNFFTIFNLMNFLLALAVFAVGSYKNMLFLGIIIINTAISTIQEIVSKRTIDKLSLISSNKVHVIRNKQKENIAINEIVLDDILQLETGNQVVVDCILKEGELEVNESFITGEAEPVNKKVGDMILSGSYIISGKCTAKVEHIGNDNFTAKISNETRYIKQIKSEIMGSLNKIIKLISIIIVPVGALLFMNQLGLEGNTVKYAVVNTVAAMIGMIPEGLILLTSTVLAVSVIRLSRSKVLVQELYCIETLARVDMLCLDKTGTITEGKMEVKDVITFENNENLEEILTAISNHSSDSNSTIEAIKQKFNKKTDWKKAKEISFSSEKKWSAVSFEDKGSYIIGAPEFILKEEYEKYRTQIEPFSNQYRTILVAHSKQELKEKELPTQITVIGLVLISDIIRKNAKETLSYFKEQGVAIKIISGDNPATVSQIAKQAGIEKYENYIDCTNIKTEEQMAEAAQKYTIFGRVTPIQKKQLVVNLKSMGHTVAMTGDGVNDIIALKEADCSIAMASGSDAAKSVSQLVLLDSNFASMPKIVAEGRRTINNIQRSASLFLSKTIYSTILAIAFVFLNMQYPFMPIQLSLIGLVCIGIPSFILALEPNKERVKGKFLGNVISKSIPTAITVVANIFIIIAIASKYAIPQEICSTLCVILTVFTGFALLFKIARPFNPLRVSLIALMIALFTGCAIFMKDLFGMVITSQYIPLVAILLAICTCIFIALQKMSHGDVS